MGCQGGTWCRMRVLCGRWLWGCTAIARAFNDLAHTHTHTLRATRGECNLIKFRLRDIIHHALGLKLAAFFCLGASNMMCVCCICGIIESHSYTEPQSFGCTYCVWAAFLRVLPNNNQCELHLCVSGPLVVGRSIFESHIYIWPSYTEERTHLKNGFNSMRL